MTMSNIITIDVEVEVEVSHGIKMAVLVHTRDKDSAAWLSSSQIEIERNGALGGIETVTLPEWPAVDKKLIGQMTAPAPLFASDRTAARLLDMQLAQFRELVECADLPGPCRLDRWDMAQLKAILRGNAMPSPSQELEI